MEIRRYQNLEEYAQAVLRKFRALNTDSWKKKALQLMISTSILRNQGGKRGNYIQILIIKNSIQKKSEKDRLRDKEQMGNTENKQQDDTFKPSKITKHIQVLKKNPN